MKALSILRNKYAITLLAMVAWLLFFDKNDVFTQYELIRKCEKLKNDKTYYLSQINNHLNQLQELKTNKNSLERFSREKYLMKKDNEDVYVFVTK